MSICEDPEKYPRGLKCVECPLGKPGFVGRIISMMEWGNIIRELAYQNWKRRGARYSSPEQRDADYKEAVRIETIKVCEEMEKMK